MAHVSKLPTALVFLFGMALFAGCRHQAPSGTAKASSKSRPKTQRIPEKTPVPRADSELADKLGLSQKELRENKLFHFADDWYGVPYKYGGCNKSGVDCSCFVNILYQDVYKKQLGRSAQEMFVKAEKISVEDAEQGDLLFFKIGGKSISHVGILLKNKYFIHSSTSKGVMLNSLDEAYYKKYFFCAGKAKV